MDIQVDTACFSCAKHAIKSWPEIIK